jgi:hypothetical protein
MGRSLSRARTGSTIIRAGTGTERPVESKELEFRAEAFNVSNSVDFGNPGQLNFNNLTNFSKITSLRNNQRLVQLALKVFF